MTGPSSAESNAGRGDEKARAAGTPGRDLGERRVPRSPARQAERSGLGPRRGQQAERRSDPRASEGVLVNWVFAPSGAQGAGLRFFLEAARTVS